MKAKSKQQYINAWSNHFSEMTSVILDCNDEDFPKAKEGFEEMRIKFMSILDTACNNLDFEEDNDA